MCLLQENPVAGHNSFVEREPWLGTVPVGELPDGMVVRPLRTRGRQAVEDCGFRLLQVRAPECGFGRALAFGFAMPPFCGNLRRDGGDVDGPQAAAFLRRNRVLRRKRLEVKDILRIARETGPILKSMTAAIVYDKGVPNEFE